MNLTEKLASVASMVADVYVCEGHCVNEQPNKSGPATSKKAKVSTPPPGDENIDSNVCCACFGNYEDDVLEGSGAVWISCACGRWLHEDCVERCKEDDEGNDRMCPLCVDVLTS